MLCGHVGAQRQVMEGAQASGEMEEGNVEGGQARGESDLQCWPRGLHGMGSHGRHFSRRAVTWSHCFCGKAKRSRFVGWCSVRY